MICLNIVFSPLIQRSRYRDFCSLVASATGTGASAIGTGALTIGTDESAIGTDALTIGTDESATGTDALTTGTDESATGFGASATGFGASAIGSFSRRVLSRISGPLNYDASVGRKPAGRDPSGRFRHLTAKLVCLFVLIVSIGLNLWLPSDCFGQQPTETESSTAPAAVAPSAAIVQQTIDRGLEWLAGQQARNGSWSAQNGGYVTPMTALAVLALTAEGSTTMQGKYSVQIRRGVDFLLTQARPSGLIGVQHDGHYTYGHGYAMMALAQVLGEEEDADRREQLIKTLTRAVAFTVDAQTKDGGWGYVSAKQGNGFDEGSTTVTQVQGLRACRNAGITVPKSCIDKAIQYIQRCTTEDGGVQYTTKGGPGRPAIMAAAIASLYNAGDYDDAYVPKLMDFCKKNINDLDQNAMGYWHYAHFYYAQVMYRTGGPEWDDYRARIVKRLVDEAGPNGAWSQGFVGDVYTTSKNLIILQLDQNILPIFQR